MNLHAIFAIFITLLLGSLGVLVAGFIPLPIPYTIYQTRALYFILGVLLSLLLFARITSWVVRTFTSLMRKLVSRIASEVTNQLTTLTTSGLHLFPQSEKKTAKIFKPIIVDTSSIIDGRILEIVKAGFLTDLLIVPDFVLEELQQVADSSDPIKRARGRRGLNIVGDLKKAEGVTLQIWDKNTTGKTVDDKLIRLSRALRGKLLTCDYNLNQVASLSQVKVLNINELANSLKSLPVPGERLQVKIIGVGKDKSQGIAYLPDGTMIIVRDGASKVSENLSIEVTKVLQGPAGRMIFGRIA
ncbi:MAG: hypothetical protein Q7S88_03200 [Candidatus Daviesbacteria bacterium]|nr:hypothetical protein [Candidatus Daviesbacteria bacterium]